MVGHPPAALPPEKETRYQLCMRLGRPRGRLGRARKTSHPQGFDQRAIQPVATVLYRPRGLKSRCNGDSLQAGKSSWQVDYRVSDLQKDGK